jgi:hypothetical protein
LFGYSESSILDSLKIIFDDGNMLDLDISKLCLGFNLVDMDVYFIGGKFLVLTGYCIINILNQTIVYFSDVGIDCDFCNFYDTLKDSDGISQFLVMKRDVDDTYLIIDLDNIEINYFATKYAVLSDYIYYINDNTDTCNIIDFDAKTSSVVDTTNHEFQIRYLNEINFPYKQIKASSERYDFKNIMHYLNEI